MSSIGKPDSGSIENEREAKQIWKRRGKEITKDSIWKREKKLQVNRRTMNEDPELKDREVMVAFKYGLFI